MYRAPGARRAAGRGRARVRRRRGGRFGEPGSPRAQAVKVAGAVLLLVLLLTLKECVATRSPSALDALGVPSGASSP
jgi:hypothetical protein